MFDLPLLRSFEAVASLSSFTKAGQQLNLTQSAVSAHIRRLEQQADCALFERNTRTVTLTPQGQALLGYTRAILRLSEDALAHMKGSSQFHLRIGTSDDLMSTWLPSVLRKFQDSRLGRTLEIHISNTSTLLDSMARGELDLIVGCRCRGDETGRRLWQEPLVWAFARGAALDQDRSLPLALFPEPCPYRDAALAALAKADRAWRIAMVSPSLGSLTAMAAAALAVTPLNAGSVPHALQILDADAQLPALPDIEFVAHIRDNLPAETALLAESVISWIKSNRPTAQNRGPNSR
ncbi:LysR family transcriptional regulator [Devosia sp. A449]